RKRDLPANSFGGSSSHTGKGPSSGPRRCVMKLYQFPLSPNSMKVVALAHEVGLSIETRSVNVFQGGARTPEMLEKNPNGKVPILEDGEFVLWESNAMLGYLAAKADR